jgi:tetratricopeptide (TPR) repeat protein
LRHFRSAIASDESYAEAYYHFGRLQHRQGYIESAIEKYNRAEELGRSDVNLYLERGKAFMEVNNQAAACLDWKRANLMDERAARNLLRKHCN